jgi:hypothetical protein
VQEANADHRGPGPALLQSPCSLTRELEASPRESGDIELHCKNEMVVVRADCRGSRCKYSVDSFVSRNESMHTRETAKDADETSCGHDCDPTAVAPNKSLERTRER